MFNLKKGLLQFLPTLKDGVSLQGLYEEGKLCGLPLNITATNIVKNNSNHFNDYIVGNVIICGLDELE